MTNADKSTAIPVLGEKFTNVEGKKKKISKLAKLSSDSYLPLDSYSRFYPISKVDL